MKLFKWVQGRQEGTTYFKFPLYSFKVCNYGFDAYILKYVAPTYLKPHKDIVTNGRHWRVNIKLFGQSIFYCENRLPSSRVIEIFRPDLLEHSLSVVSNTLKLSFGFVKFN